MTHATMIHTAAFTDTLSDLHRRPHRLTTTVTTTTPQRPSTSTSNDQNESHYTINYQSKCQSNDHCTKNPDDQPHQCITRSDGVVRALRARTGDQQPTAPVIVSTAGFMISSGGF